MRAGAAMLLLLAACSEPRERDERSDGGTGLHEEGILDPADEDFHGRLVEGLGWDLNACAGCHGEDFSGGPSQVSCSTASCHAKGPTACDTCHDTPPATGAHLAHEPRAVCSDCHVVPARWDDDGHVRTGGVADPPPVEVTLGGLASATPRPEDRDGPPAWDPAAGTCANVYCHGDVFGDAAATITRPAWHGGASQAACGTCHGQPPSTHAQATPPTACVTCHPTDAAHVDGIAQLGREDGCAGCHGSDGDPAPPVDLDGELFTTALGVGAHRSHLEARHRISAPVPCSACHLVPDELGAPGHIDTAPPAELVLLSGAWDRVAATCSGVSCHGAATPVWTRVDLGEIACGTCHGVPPDAAPHVPTMTLDTCSGCHPATVDDFGNILVDGPAGDESEHIDGDIDL